jgi:hypothetical protein
MRHGGAVEPEETAHVGGAEPCPVGEGFQAAVAGEAGADGQGEQRGAGIAHSARVALIHQLGERGGKRVHTKGKRKVSGQLEAERQRGRVHATPRLDMCGSKHPHHPHLRCLRVSRTLQEPCCHAALPVVVQ